LDKNVKKTGHTVAIRGCPNGLQETTAQGGQRKVGEATPGEGEEKKKIQSTSEVRKKGNCLPINREEVRHGRKGGVQHREELKGEKNAAFGRGPRQHGKRSLNDSA